MTRTALVTGGNRGIGFAIASGLTSKGIDVVIGSRDAVAGRDAAHRIGARSVQLDLQDRASTEAAISQIDDVEILVNNAGVLGTGDLFSDDAQFKASMEVMVDGPYHLLKAVTPYMKRNGYGRIVNVSSGWGAFSDGVAGPGAYGVAKAALNALTVSAARALPETIKINAMCPGWVRTRMGGSSASLSAEEGADTAIWLATLPETGPTGMFFRDRERIGW
ncbi:SDR family NAD(P)-dependent oxidoreductase [Gymnodinialimonas hymeniacidonis]|uniref:SDR family NAD(P)-dependent oxidoreductase n=1 Tax=Gymnodinialimonas hymeniacidonis TaxID=3126508 RepID=UPI0034C67F83